MSGRRARQDGPKISGRRGVLGESQVLGLGIGFRPQGEVLNCKLYFCFFFRGHVGLLVSFCSVGRTGPQLRGATHCPEGLELPGGTSPEPFLMLELMPASETSHRSLAITV